MDGTASLRTQRDTAGNRRLLAIGGVLLLVALLIEYGSLLLGLHSGWLPTHIFVGFVLIPVTAWKVGVAAYRFTRYYTGDADYRDAGPPTLLLRVVAPILAAGMVVLLGSGLMLVTGSHGDQPWRMLHKLSYLVVSAMLIVHVLAYILRSLRGFADDLLAHDKGALLRLGASLAVVAIAIAFALLVPHRTTDDHHGGRFGDDGRFNGGPPPGGFQREH